jgi:hypothetical protein
MRAAAKSDEPIASDDLQLRGSLATRRATMLDVVLSAPLALLYVCGVELYVWRRHSRARVGARWFAGISG